MKDIEGLSSVRAITKTPCIQLVGFTSLAIGLLALIIISNNNLSFFSQLPSSPWSWTTSSSSSHNPSPPPPSNPELALYPTFTNPKMQKAVEKMVEELNKKSRSMRRGMERDKEMERTEAGLGRARAFIKDAITKTRLNNPPPPPPPPLISTTTQDNLGYVPHGEIYRNPYVFQR